MKTPVIAVFDIGKTNKKVFLWNQHYQIVFEKSENFEEILDEDGFHTENLSAVIEWVLVAFNEVNHLPEYDVKALNFSAYGASIVYVDENGHANLPLYNYLKPFPASLSSQYYSAYGVEELVAQETASPVLGHLNSGMQVYSIKYLQPEKWNEIKWVLHWPNFLSSLFSKQYFAELTSIGCHTQLWDFSKNDYHHWVYAEKISEKLPQLVEGTQSFPLAVDGTEIPVGVGLHDSSSALFPYLTTVKEEFILLSTGTWCISLHPFNDSLLTDVELQNDVLCYMQLDGKPVKASRLFAGNEHEIQTKRLEKHYSKPAKSHKNVIFDSKWLSVFKQQLIDTLPDLQKENMSFLLNSGFDQRDLSKCSTYEEAYHQLMVDLMVQQIYSLRLVYDTKPVTKILVDGGFSHNEIYMNFLANTFDGVEVYGAEVAQASALGAALAIHSTWNKKEIPLDLVQLKRFLPCE
jgi:sugar (pentulose or hexulose) kinase